MQVSRLWSLSRKDSMKHAESVFQIHRRQISSLSTCLFAGKQSSIVRRSQCLPQSYDVFGMNKRSFRTDVSEIDRLTRMKPAISAEDLEDQAKDEALINSDGYLDDDTDMNKYMYLENDEPNPSHLLGKHLLRYSRVHYRHITEFPEWFLNRQAEIVQYRSVAQIRRCLKNWMIETNQFEKYRKFATKPLVWRDDDAISNNAANIKAYGPDESVAYAHYFLPSRFTVMRRLFNELQLYLPNFQPKRIIDYGCGPGTAGAAAIDAFGAENIKMYSGVDMSQAMIDAAKIMMEGHDGIDSVFWNKIGDVAKRVEKSQDRFDLAVLSYTLSELTTDTARRAATQIMFEMLDVGGCLVIVESGNPMGSHTVRTARQFLLDNFNAKSSTPETAKTSDKHKKHVTEIGNDDLALEKKEMKGKGELDLILPMRDYDRKQIGARTIAPCTHDKPCPLTNGVFCSFSQKSIGGMIRKASEEKFSYVVIQKVLVNSLDNKIAAMVTSSSSSSPATPAVETNTELDGEEMVPGRKTIGVKALAAIDTWTVSHKEKEKIKLLYEKNGHLQPTPREVLLDYQLCDGYEQVVDLTNRLLDDVDWDEYNPPLYRSEWARIIRSPMKAKGHITLDACSPNGTIVRSILSRSNVMSIPSLFVSVRKTTWGGIFPANGSDELRFDEPTKSPLTFTNKGQIEGSKHQFSRPVEDKKVKKSTKKKDKESESIENDMDFKALSVSSKDSSRIEEIFNNTKKNVKIEAGKGDKKVKSSFKTSGRSKESSPSSSSSSSFSARGMSETIDGNNNVIIEHDAPRSRNKLTKTLEAMKQRRRAEQGVDVVKDEPPLSELTGLAKTLAILKRKRLENKKE